MGQNNSKARRKAARAEKFGTPGDATRQENPERSSTPAREPSSGKGPAQPPSGSAPKEGVNRQGR